MAAVAPVFGVLGAVASFAGTMASANAQRAQAAAMENQAIAERQAAEYRARMQEKQAMEERAVAQRKAFEKREEGQYIQSKLQAGAAASGAGADDPTIVQLGSDIAAKTEYSALSQMYSGESKGVDLENQAGLDRYVGEAKANATRAEAAAKRSAAGATMLGGVGGLFGSFGKMSFG